MQPVSIATKIARSVMLFFFTERSELMPRPVIFHLPNGDVIRLRTARQADASALRQLFFQLSDATRYNYFGVGIPRLPAFAERVVALGMTDGHLDFAAVAEARHGLVGVARFARSAIDPVADIGILLADAWQSQGIGTQLLIQLAQAAQQRAIGHFRAQVLGENRRALRLVRRVFPEARVTWSSGAFEVAICLKVAAYDRRSS